MNFDTLARHYRWMERILAGQKLQRCRTRWLPDVAGSKNILLAGEGHGRFLVACAQAFPEAQITYIDASKEMLQVAREEAQKRSIQVDRIHFVHGTIPERAAPRAAFDLIVTNYFFDCFTAQQLPGIVAFLAEAAAPQASWLVSEFHEPSAGWRRVRARAILFLAYSFFRVVTRLPARRVPDYGPLLCRHGFGLERQARFDFELLVSELWRRA